MHQSTTLGQRLLSTIKSVDLLGQHIHLTLRGATEVKTYAGAALSLAAVSIFLAITIYTFKEAFRSDRPSVLMESSITRDYPVINLVETKQLPVIFLFNKETPTVAADIITYIHIKMTRVHANITGLNVRTLDIQDIPLVPCSDLGWESIKRFSTPDSEPLEKLFVMNYGLCPNITDTNVVVQGKATSTIRDTVEITVYPCVPELLLPNQTCMTATSLVTARLYLAQASLNLDLANYKMPVSFSWDSENEHALSLGSQLSVLSKMKIVEVRNNEWGLYGESAVSSLAQLDQSKPNYFSRNVSQTSCTLNQISVLRTCEPLAAFVIGSGGKKEVYTRSYSGVLGVIGVIGGARALIFTLFFYFYGLFSSCTVKNKIKESVQKSLANYYAGVRSKQSSNSPDQNYSKVDTPPSRRKNSALDYLELQSYQERAAKALDVDKLTATLAFVEDLSLFFLGPVHLECKSPDKLSSKSGGETSTVVLTRSKLQNAIKTHGFAKLALLDRESDSSPMKHLAETSSGLNFEPKNVTSPPNLQQSIQQSFLAHVLQMRETEQNDKPQAWPAQSFLGSSNQAVSPVEKPRPQIAIRKIMPRLLPGKDVRSAMELPTDEWSGTKDGGTPSKGTFWKKRIQTNLLGEGSTPRTPAPKKVIFTESHSGVLDTRT